MLHTNNSENKVENSSADTTLPLMDGVKVVKVALYMLVNDEALPLSTFLILMSEGAL